MITIGMVLQRPVKFAGIMSPMRSPDPLVTVVMATFNRSNIIRYAIESVRRQTCIDWELLVVGDAWQERRPEGAAYGGNVRQRRGVRRAISPARRLHRSPAAGTGPRSAAAKREEMTEAVREDVGLVAA
jgi:glycosyl transferase family 2